MDIAWAYSLNTVQFIDNAIYGATVLGGNILRTEIGGTSEIIWENDYSNPHKGGVFLYSLLYCGKLYLFPYISEYIVIYDISKQTVEKIYFEDKGKNEKIYPHRFEKKILMFGLDTGRVWELGEEILKVNDMNQEAGKLFKYKGIIGERYTLFYGIERKLAAVFDCKNLCWIIIHMPDFIKGGFAEGKLLWYAAGDKFYKHDIETESYTEIAHISEECSSVSVVRTNDNAILIVEDKGNGVYLLNKETQSVQEIYINFFLEHNLHVAVEIDGSYCILADYKKLDWMLWNGDKYAVYNATDMSVTDIPIFNMDNRTEWMINERYARIAWDLAPNETIHENEKEGLKFLIDSLELVF